MENYSILAGTRSPLNIFPNSLILIHPAHVVHRRSPPGWYKEGTTHKDSKELAKCKQVIDYRVKTKSCNIKSQFPFSILPCAVCCRKDITRGKGYNKGSPQSNSVDSKTFHLINRGRKRSLSSLSVLNLRMKLDNLAEVVGRGGSIFWKAKWEINKCWLLQPGFHVEASHRLGLSESWAELVEFPVEF